MIMKRIAIVALASLLALGATAGINTHSVKAQTELKIGLVTDVGEVDDRSFNQSAWEGAQAAAKAAGGTADYVETKDPADYANNIAQFADNDYDIIITVGFALGEATATAAKKYPNIHFIGVDQFQGEAITNLTGLIFTEGKAGFLAGVLAARLTKSGTIAAVLGTDQVPPVVAFKNGYEAGAKYINPDIKILSTYHPGGLAVAFVDPKWGSDTAKQALDQGADVVFGAGGKTGNGALQAVAERTTKDKPLYCIGVDTDQWDTVPEAQPCLVSSAMKLITKGVVDIVKQHTDGTITAGNFVGDVGLAPFHDFESVVPDEVKKELDSVSEKLLSDEIKLNGDGTMADMSMEATPEATPAS
ncbi:MAG: BMP family ABC transporter substrate-binding protein [Anaerolineae bacterium]|nr:BMP family ABC transporter substrate-binding protein [Anaerolineae bacterium]